MVETIIKLPSFEKSYIKLEKANKERLDKIIKRIEEYGLNVLKILRIKGRYILAEAKSKRPRIAFMCLWIKIHTNFILQNGSLRTFKKNLLKN